MTYPVANQRWVAGRSFHAKPNRPDIATGEGLVDAAAAVERVSLSKLPTPSQVKQISNLLGEVSGFVAAIVAYLVAVSGRSPGPFPQTTAVITVVVTTIALWVWRWSQITRQKPAPESRLLVVGTVLERPRLSSSRDHLLDPFRSSGVRSYALSLMRRRVEAVVLILLSLTIAPWTGFKLPKAIPELTGTSSHVSLPLACIGSEEQDALRVVIADFDEVGPQPQFLLENRLFDYLSERVEGDMAICRLQQVVALRSEALALGEQTQAAIIVWGRSDVVFEAHLEVAGWDLSGRDLPPLPSEAVADFAFQVREPLHLGFLTEFTFSEILYLDSQLERARQVLSETLAMAEQQGLAEDNAEDLAEAYFLLGFLFDSGISSKPDSQRALAAYSDAFDLDPTLYAAILNRGKVYEQLSEIERAMADYTLLIDEQTPLAASAYVNRAYLQPTRQAAERDFESAIELDPLEGHWHRGSIRLYQWNDPEGAVDDFKEAVKLDPKEFFFYHSLGEAQLIAGQTDEAVETYREIIPYLDDDTRQVVIQELEELSQNLPHLKESVAAIVRTLQAATPLQEPN